MYVGKNSNHGLPLRQADARSSSVGCKPVARETKDQWLCKLYPDQRGSEPTPNLKPTLVRRQNVYKDQVGVYDNGVKSPPSPLVFAPATIVIDDAKDLTTLHFTSPRNHRRPGLQLQRGAADSDKDFERGSWRFTRSDSNHLNDPLPSVCGHFTAPRRRCVLSVGAQVSRQAGHHASVHEGRQVVYFPRSHMLTEIRCSLPARKLEDAKKRIEKTIEWRRDFKPDLIPPEEVPL